MAELKVFTSDGDPLPYVLLVERQGEYASFTLNDASGTVATGTLSMPRFNRLEEKHAAGEGIEAGYDAQQDMLILAFPTETNRIVVRADNYDVRAALGL